MKFINTDRSNVLAAKKGGGFFLAIFGLPFFCAGLGIISCIFIPAETRNGDPIPWFVGIPFGGIFAIVGASLMLGRSGINIDLRRNTIETWWGLLVPFRTKSRPLDEFSNVLITKEVRRSKNSTYTVYPVYLEPIDESKKLKLEEPRNMQVSRKTAETIAKFVEFSIHDSSSGTEVLREAGTLDESLRDKAERLGEQIEIPTAPAVVKSRIKPRGGSLEIDIPAAGFKPMTIIPIVVIAVFVMVPLFGILPAVMNDMADNPKAKLIFGGFIGFFFVALPVLVGLSFVFKALLSKTSVIVQKSGISASTGLISKTKTIPADEVEELFVTRPAADMNTQAVVRLIGERNAILIRSDEQTISFGAHLSREESEYIAYLIKSVLISS